MAIFVVTASCVAGMAAAGLDGRFYALVWRFGSQVARVAQVHTWWVGGSVCAFAFLLVAALWWRRRARRRHHGS